MKNWLYFIGGKHHFDIKGTKIFIYFSSFKYTKKNNFNENDKKIKVNTMMMTIFQPLKKKENKTEKIHY